MAFIIDSPLRYAHVLLGDLHRNWVTYLSQCTGYAGTIPRVFGWLYLGAVFLVALVDGRTDVAIDLRGKATIVLVLVSVYTLVNTLNYLGWNPVGSSTIKFIQGRYYIPILPLPFLLLSNRRLASSIPDQRLSVFAAGCTIFSSCVAIRYIILRWYGV